VFIPLLDHSQSCRQIAADWLFLHAKTLTLPHGAVLLSVDNIDNYPQVKQTYLPTSVPSTFTNALAGTPAERRGSFHSRTPQSPTSRASRMSSDRSVLSPTATVPQHSTSSSSQSISSTPRILRRSPRLS
jgi:hypothetical protein